jgi:hypothetical protein
VFYDATRKLVLRGADGVVFVADSQPSVMESNIESLENLKANLRLNRIDPDKIALVFQYNKRDLPGVSSVAEMNAYLKPGNAPVVEAAAINGTGVTATLRAAITRILENLKNNTDISLFEEGELPPPDLKVKSGATASSAGTPKLAVGGKAAPAPVAAVETAVEEDPFASVAVVDESNGNSRDDLQSLLSSARQLIASLESALDRARAHEQEIADKISRL